MRKILLTIEYDGARFCGWQSQKNGRAVQDEIERAAQKALGHSVRIYGSGRTDRGVHAKAQRAHFTTCSNLAADVIKRAINYYLPDDVAIKRAIEVGEDFHARFNAKSKTYEYKFWDSAPSPLRRNTHFVSPFELDSALMNECAKLFLGSHDFRAFCICESEKDTTREIYLSKVERVGNEVVFTVCGNGFLFNMVRIMAEALYLVGIYKLTIEQVQNILNSGCRADIKGLAPAEGLYLYEVQYGNKEY